MSGAPAAGYRPGLHPAGGDAQLRVAVEDVRLGRWLSMRNLLAATGENWALRTSRSQVLASAAVRSHAVREWLAEEPGSADALMMRARVGTEMVLRAHRSGHPVAAEVLQARAAAFEAAGRYPADPVPWVCLLAQAQTDPDQAVPEHWIEPPDPMLPPGPWNLLRQARHRDAFNREAHHRLLQFLLVARTGGPAATVNFAELLAAQIPEDSHSSLLVLPLYAYAEHYHRRRGDRKYDVQDQAHWGTEFVRLHIRRALTWFAHSDPAFASPLDLNFTAHAAWADRQYREAAPLFDAIGPHMTSRPWSYVAKVPGDADYAVAEFDKALRQCRGVAAAPPRLLKSQIGTAPGPEPPAA